MADELITKQSVLDLAYKGGSLEGLIHAFKVENLNGVNAVVLPCKVGDTVYVLGESVVSEIPVLQIIIDEDECFVCAIGDFRGGCYPFSAFGKTVFLTKEEAEKALEGGEDNANS